MSQFARWYVDIESHNIGVLCLYKGFGMLRPLHLKDAVRDGIRSPEGPISEIAVFCADYEFNDVFAQLQRESPVFTDFDLLGQRPMVLVSLSQAAVPMRAVSVRPKISNAQIPKWCTSHAWRKVIWPSLLRHISKRDGVVLTAPAGYYFEKSSERGSTHFIRAENATCDGPETSAIALALLAKIKLEGLETIRVDSASIFGVVFAMLLHASRFTTSLSFPRVESFHSWNGVKELKQAATDTEVAIISASSSQGLATEVSMRTGLPPDRVIMLMSFAPQKFSCVVEVIKPKEYRDIEIAADTLVSLRPLRVVGEHFLFEQKKPKCVRLTPRHKPIQAELDFVHDFYSVPIFQALACAASAVKVRRITLLPEALLNATLVEALTLWVSTQISVAGPTKCIAILHNPSASGRLFAELVKGVAEQWYGHTIRLLPLNQASELQMPRQRDGVLITSDAIGSGRSLVQASAALRDSAPSATLCYLVAFHVAPSAVLSKRLRATLERSHTNGAYRFRAWQTFAVGSDPATIDPCSRAQMTLDALRDDHDLCAVERRLPFAAAKELAATDYALSKNAIYMPENYKPELLCRPILFLMLSGVLQRAREATNAPPDETLASTDFEQVILEPDTFTRYSDDALRSAMLWAAKSTELDYSSDADASAEMKAFLLRLQKHWSIDREGVFVDFALALLVEHICLTKSDHRDVLKAMRTAEYPSSTILGKLIGGRAVKRSIAKRIKTGNNTIA